VIVVLDCIRKPQNLGAVLRLVLATNSQVYVTGNSLKHNHPKAKSQIYKWARPSADVDIETLVDVRYVDSLEELTNEFRSKGYRVIATSPRAGITYTDLDYTNDNFVVVFGSEYGGLSSKKLEMMDMTIKIPMLNDMESLNLSNAVAIILYEAMRQRGFK
jgi:tRNA G18 (ribose-2'-O)-methylase SpoU